MKILLVCPIPMEFFACREVLCLRDHPPLMQCRTARGMAGGVELVAVESGPAKARAAAATVGACHLCEPDLVIDTGSCCGVEPGVPVGQIILGDSCYEYDIGGDKLPRSILKAMKLDSGFSFLPREERENLQRGAVEEGRESGYPVRVGPQACGEVLIQDLAVRDALYTTFHAAGANWETAGVFIGALKAGRPPFSVRIVTDLGDRRAQQDFHRNIRAASRSLYRYLQVLLENGWAFAFQESWGKISGRVEDRLAGSVRPKGSAAEDSGPAKTRDSGAHCVRWSSACADRPMAVQ